MADDFLLFAHAVALNWVTYMCTGPVLGDQILQWSSKAYSDWAAKHSALRRRCVVSLLSIGLVWANFYAWSEQHHLAEANADLSREKQRELEGEDGHSGLKGQVIDLREKVKNYEQQLAIARAQKPDEIVRFMKPPEVNLYAGHPQRHLSDDQKKKLTAALVAMKSELKGIMMFSEAGESARYLLDFIGVHKQAGIDIDGPYTSGISGESENGVMVGFANPDKPSALGLKYIEALRSAGLAVGITKSSATDQHLDFDLFICDQ